MKTLHFTCGLPRSGSTLLQNILAQNPKFHATETSGFVDVLFGVRNSWPNLIEHRAHPRPQGLHNVLKAIYEAYYADIDKSVIFVKTRGVLPYVEMLEKVLDQKLKILVPVRPVPDIIASFEKLYRETSKVRQPPGEAENYFQFQTIQGRCDYWMRKDQVVGLALSRLEDAVTRGLSDRLHFVDFNQLTTNPKLTLSNIYNFLEEDLFEHNFDYVEQVTQENDDVHGFVNLHKIQNKVKPVPSTALQVLGKEVMESLSPQK
jgi:sulfotransferase